MGFVSIAALLLYITILVFIGIFSAKKSRSSSGYLLGDRSLNYWVAAISANASDMSVWLFMGLPMAIYQEGLIHVWTAIGLLVFMFLNWHWVAPKLRAQSEKTNSLTLLSFFDAKLNNQAYYLRITGAIITLCFLTIYIAAGITGMGYLFDSIFGLPYFLGCVLSIIAVLTYITLGGFTAICYTDFAQGIFLLIVILLVPILILFLPETPSTNLNNFTQALNEPIIPSNFSELLKALTLALGWGIGYFGQPHILNKFMAIKKTSDINKSKYLSTSWQTLALGGSVLTGLAAHYFFQTPPSNPELIFVHMVGSLFAPFFASFILCAILAATLSTVDSQILVVASVCTEDIYALIGKKNHSEKQLLLVSRLSAIGCCLIGLIIALLKSSTIFNLVFICWVGIGASFGPLVIASLYFKKLTPTAALSGMLSGLGISLLWFFLDSVISPLVPGFITGFCIIWLLSQWAPNRK